ncbi:MAG: homoserine O-acetyltransferase [Bacteroidales bacterium]|jgi:homoserine O-acetyltransferase|nr:homoserine O-acetyltransferase [Bacteroidales bacterium]
MQPLLYRHNESFLLETGATLPELTIAYNTYGNPSNPVIWVCHALTANSDVAEWWPNTVATGRFLDPEKYFIVCANVLGSHYGTTGPLSINPNIGSPYYNSFPLITVRDMVKAHRLLAKYLGIEKIKTLIGSSLGGYQCLEWAIANPEVVDELVLIATASKTTPWITAFNHTQRMAIESDATFGHPNRNAGAKGMAAARAIALLSYRGPVAYNRTQEDPDDSKMENHRVCSYQEHQGEKLVKRFNAYSYYRLTQTLDAHNVSRNRGKMENVLSSITARTLLVAISSDLLFPVGEHELMAKHIHGSTLRVIDSDFAHDGFLVESDKLNDIILEFYG